MEISKAVENDISHIELAGINFDQWILTIALRAYTKDGSVKGMVHVIFKAVRGFRYLDEGDMLNYKWPENCTRQYYQLIDRDGWSEQERNFGNIATSGHSEYLIATENECISVLAYQKPTLVKDLD